MQIFGTICRGQQKTSGLCVFNLFTRPQTSICCLESGWRVLGLVIIFMDQYFQALSLLSTDQSEAFTSQHLQTHLNTRQHSKCPSMGFTTCSKKLKFSCTLYGWQHADLCERCGLWTSRLKCAALHNSITPTPPVQAIQETQHTGFSYIEIWKWSYTFAIYAVERFSSVTRSSSYLCCQSWMSTCCKSGQPMTRKNVPVFIVLTGREEQPVIAALLSEYGQENLLVKQTCSISVENSPLSFLLSDELKENR